MVHDILEVPETFEERKEFYFDLFKRILRSEINFYKRREKMISQLKLNAHAINYDLAELLKRASTYVDYILAAFIDKSLVPVAVNKGFYEDFQLFQSRLELSQIIDRDAAKLLQKDLHDLYYMVCIYNACWGIGMNEHFSFACENTIELWYKIVLYMIE